MASKSRRPSSAVVAAVSQVLRALSLCAPMALLDGSPAFTQDIEPSSLSLDIPSQPLAKALTEFATQTGLQIAYVSEEVRNQSSHAVKAGLRNEEALAQLLRGTGLRFEYLTPQSIRILAPEAISRQTTLTVPAPEELHEVIVTANRREEDLQDVPLTVQVITGDQLRQFSASTFEDLLRYTANVTFDGYGPGTGTIFMRGLGSGGIAGNQSQAAFAPFPNVALYLDDQSMQFPARNNDVYMVDLQRVEVLEGPQGTLFGGGAEAGAIRYITNKPKVDATTGDVNVGFGVTSGGAPDSILNATLNLPLIEDTLAVRATVFWDRRGGYISNVPGTISFNVPSPSLPGVREISPVASNAALVGSNTNPVTYQGFRLSGLYRFNDEWDLLIQQNYQSMLADGYFAAYPFDPNGNALKPDEITAFTPAFNKDRYESTSWTLNGRFADLQLVYAGSFMIRHIEGQQDYSNYLRNQIGAYYACIGPGAAFNPAYFSVLQGKPLQCYAPVGSWRDTVKNEHQSHELRISTNPDYRARALVGAYWEKFVIDDDMDFDYLAIPQCSPANLAIAQAGGPDCLSAVGPVPGSFAIDPGLRVNMNNAFGTDIQRGYRQYAFFASVDFDLIPKVLTLTGGTRRYHYNEFEQGSEWYTATTSPLIVDHPNGACTAAGACGAPINLSKSESGFRSRGSLTWHITPDIMTYYTYSEGFRPGGFNRVFSLPGQAPHLHGTAPYCGSASTDPRCLPGGSLFNLDTNQYVEQAGFNSDSLINNELGFKSEFLNHRLLLDASAYYMHWNNAQQLAFDLVGLCGCVAYVNGPNYEIKGIELQLAARVGEGLTLRAAGSWNRSSETTAPCLTSAGITPASPHNPTPAGQCITVVQGLPYAPLGALDSSPPFSSPLIFNVQARYDWYVGPYKPFAWVGASHTGATSNEPSNYPSGNAPVPAIADTRELRYSIPAYTTYDGAIGVATNTVTAQINGSNLLNSDAATNIDSGQYIKSQIPLRPRVLMAQFSYRF